MGIKDNLSSMYDEAADSAATIGKKISSGVDTAKEYGQKALDVADEVSDNEVFKALVVDKDDPVDVALTTATAVPLAGIGAGAAKIGYKGAKLAKAATNVFKSEKIAGAAADVGKAVSKGAEKASGWFSDVEKSAGDMWDATKKVAGEKIERGIKSAGDVWDATKKVAGQTYEAGKQKLGDVWDSTKKVAGETYEAGKKKLGEAWDTTKRVAGETWDATKKAAGKVWKGTKDLGGKIYKGSKNIFNRVGGIMAGYGLSKLFGGGDKTEGEGGGSFGDGGGGVVSQGALVAARSKLPQITPAPAEQLETLAAQLQPSVSGSTGKGGEGSIGSVRDILERIYMVLQQTNRTVEKISADTGNIARYSSMRETSADLANANILARSGESGSYSQITKEGYQPSNKTSEDSSLFSKVGDVLKGVGILGAAMATGGDFETQLADVEDTIKEGYQTWKQNKFGEDGIGQAGVLKSTYKIIKGFLGFGDEEKGPDVSRVSKEIMPETTKSLEKEEMMGSIDKSGKYSPSIVDKSVSNLLERISIGEGTGGEKGYSTTLGFGKYDPTWAKGRKLEEMSLSEVNKLQSDMLKNPSNKMNSSAVGKYQIVKTTLFGASGTAENPEKGSIADKLGLKAGDTFSKEVQDKIGEELLKRRGLDKFKSGKISEEKFIKNLSQEWASIANPETGKSFYGQHTGTSVEQIKEALYRPIEQENKVATKEVQKTQQQLASKETTKTAQELISEEINNPQQPKLAAKEKMKEDIVINPPQQQEIEVSQTEPTQIPRNTAQATNSQQMVPSDPLRTSGQAGQNVNNPPLGNVRDDDPLILSMQYSNLRTV